MTFPTKMTTPPPPKKGVVRCFTCRERTTAKDGLWHNTKTQSVFLCKTCGAQALAEERNGRKSTSNAE
ncbi:MAG: hypothetical protein H7301_01870 [Cryobacterium sp.]|nr:hypothetical protein [Oligoflexia bacterium]